MTSYHDKVSIPMIGSNVLETEWNTYPFSEITMFTGFHSSEGMEFPDFWDFVATSLTF